MVTISLCMIVKNEEEVLDRCLESVADLVDEIIVVDTGSNDKTLEIAARYTEHVLHFAWRDDFAAARNFAFDHAAMDYCMWLDADDVLLPQDREQFRQQKLTLSNSVDVVMMPYHVSFDTQGKPTFWYYRERILRNSPGYRWQGRVHEAITPGGQVVYWKAAVSHKKLRPGDPDRNLRILEDMKESGQLTTPRHQFYYARELYDHGRFQEASQELEAFLARQDGWLENQIDACRLLAHCRYALGQEQQALTTLLRSLELDVPRAELCCEIGRHFFDRGQYATAVFWYDLALTRPYHPESGGFILADCYDYIPFIQLCVCYDRMGDLEKAEAYNEKAGQVKPNSQAYLANRRYFMECKGQR